MKHREIRCPKFCAVFFLLSGLGELLSIVTQLLRNAVIPDKIPVSSEIIISAIISCVIYIFVSVVLFMKRYDKLLIGAIGAMVALSISNIVAGSLSVSDILSLVGDALLLALTIIMIYGFEKLKGITIKARYIILAFYVVSFVLGILSVSGYLYDKLGSGAPIIGLTAITFIPSGVLAGVNYFKLVNWLADPYEKN